MMNKDIPASGASSRRRHARLLPERQLGEAERIASKSRLSERDAEEIAKSMDSAMYQKWLAHIR